MGRSVVSDREELMRKVRQEDGKEQGVLGKLQIVEAYGARWVEGVRGETGFVH